MLLVLIGIGGCAQTADTVEEISDADSGYCNPSSSDWPECDYGPPPVDDDDEIDEVDTEE